MGAPTRLFRLIGARGYEQLGPGLGNVQYIIHQRINFDPTDDLAHPTKLR